MPDVGLPTIDQLVVLLAVVQEGSFAAAGRKLGRATSAISYAIATLERQLGVILFDRIQTRKPQLTGAGQAILAKARLISGGIDDLIATVRGLQDGLEPEVSVAIDVMLPTQLVVDVIQRFEARFPTVTLRLHVEALGAISQIVKAGFADIGIAGALHIDENGLEQLKLGNVQMVAVAAPRHPLASGDKNEPGVVKQYRQLVLTVRSPFEEGEDVAVLGGDVWRLADLGAKHALLLGGCGWGFMPEPMVRDDIALGRLVNLDIPEFSTGVYSMRIIYRTESPPGPAAKWMADCFSELIGRQSG